MPGHQSLNDEELVVLLKEGNEAAYTLIFDRYYGLLFAHAIKMLQNEDEAKDVVQELFEVLWTKRQDLILKGSLSSYLYASIRNRILNCISHKKVECKYLESLGMFIGQENEHTDYYVRERELKRIIEAEIDALPLKMQQIFKLSRGEYLSHKEIASRLQISELTVKTQVKRALKILKPRLGFILFFLSLLKW